MDEEDFKGTIVLEKLSEIGKVEAFFDAIDSDNFGRAQNLMKKAGIDAPTIAMVLQKMSDGEN